MYLTISYIIVKGVMVAKKNRFKMRSFLSE